MIDPFTGEAMTYEGGEYVRDLFTREVLLDINYEPLIHAAGDLMLHFAGDPVVQSNGDVQRYLGGEQFAEEDGSAVFNGDRSAFLHEGGQAKIHNGGDQVYELIDENGLRVEIGSAYQPPTFDVPANAVTNLSLNYNITGNDLISVVLFDGTRIRSLDPSNYSIDRSNDRITVFALDLEEDGEVKISIATPAYQQAGDPIRYFGNEPVQIGEPVTDSSGNLKLDENGNVVLYESTVDSRNRQIFHRRGESVYRLIDTQATGPFTAGDFEIATFLGGELKLYIGNEPKLYRGGETVFSNNTESRLEPGTFVRLSGLGMREDILFSQTDEVQVNLGAGDDTFVVEATGALTQINGGPGDDNVIVTSKFNSLDEIQGDLIIDLGVPDVEIQTSERNSSGIVFEDIYTDTDGGRNNTLFVSDAHDPDGNDSVVITDGTITGLAPALITYDASHGFYESVYEPVSGTFSYPITIVGSEGVDLIDVNTTRSDPPVIEITRVNAWEGDDVITVNEDLAQLHRYLVVEGHAGNDLIDATVTQAGVAAFGFGSIERLDRH
ncbi:MAG: hypothetical protein ACPGXK_17245, partial [Phycisphaerae bacterium]